MKKILSIFVVLLMLFATVMISGGSRGIFYLIDFPSILILEVISVSMLIFSNLWADYINGLKILSNDFEATTKEIKISVVAFQQAIKYTYYASFIVVIIGLIMVIRALDDPRNIALALSVNILVFFYAVIINLFHNGVIGKLKKELIYRETI